MHCIPEQPSNRCDEAFALIIQNSRNRTAPHKDTMNSTSPKSSLAKLGLHPKQRPIRIMVVGTRGIGKTGKQVHLSSLENGVAAIIFHKILEVEIIECSRSRSSVSFHPVWLGKFHTVWGRVCVCVCVTGRLFIVELISQRIRNIRRIDVCVGLNAAVGQLHVNTSAMRVNKCT